jgi:toxin ParE1/3/4
VKRRLLFRPEAEADLLAAASFYEDKRPGLGAELLTAMERALAAIEDAPGAQPFLQHGRRYRKYTLARFPCVIVFTEEEAAVTILAVAHAKRRPDPR